MELQPLLQKCWKNALNLMYSVTTIIPRKFPPFQIDKTIMGFLIMNLDKRRVFSSMHPHGEEGDNKQMTISRKLDTMRAFVRSTVGPIFPDIYVPNPYSVDSNTGGKKKYHFVIQGLSCESFFFFQKILLFVFPTSN